MMDEDVDPLPPGSVAPSFTLRRTPQAGMSLHRVQGHPIVLVFYPVDWEPVSREQLTLYQEYLPEFGHFGACLLGISIDHAVCHGAFAREAGIRFPLLSDFHPKGAVCKLYGVYRQSEELSARALFVVDSRGIIRFSQAYPDLLNPGVHDLLTTLEAITAEAHR